MYRAVCCAMMTLWQTATALSATCPLATKAPAGSYTEAQAVPYSATESGNVIKRIDDAKPPVVVFIHGGWFVKGTADIFDPEAQALAYNAHLAIFNIDYHLTVPKTPVAASLNPFPTAVRDARCALRWVANPANGAAWGFDSSRVGVIGLSAGANLAAMAVTVSGPDYDDPTCPSATQTVLVKGVVGMYGVYDFPAGTWPQAAPYLGGQATTSPTGVLASPQSWISAKNAPYPPFMFVRGTVDGLFPESQQDTFAAALAATGDNVIAEEVAGEGHGFGLFQPNPAPGLPQATCNVFNFFADNL